MSNKVSSTIGRHHVIRSSLWVFGGQFFSQFLRLASNLIMTRLLVPEMFGVMTVANTVIVGISLCSYIGLEHNIIQSPRGDEKEFLDSAWAIQIVRAILIWLVVLGISLSLYLANQAGILSVGSVYADKDLPLILTVLSFMALLGGFESMKKATASRHMLVDKLIRLEIVCQVIALLTMIAFALVQQSIWALVAGTMVGSVAHLIASYVALPGQANKFVWDKKIVAELFHFGKWILLTTIMGFFIQNLEKLILGALIAPQLLGIYSIAIFMTTALNEVLSKWAGAVVLPVFSRVHRENSEALQKTYYKYSLPFNVLTLFSCGLLFNAGYILIEILYDSRYSAAGHMIQILSISLLGARTLMAEECYVAIGKPKLSIPMKVSQLIVLIVFLVPAYRHFGMDGALYVIAINILLTLPVTWYLLKKIGILDWKREIITLPAFFVGYGFSKLIVIAYNSIKQMI